MPISTYVGDLGTPFIFTFNVFDRTGALTHPNISGFVNANFTFHLWNGTTLKVCTGNWTVVDGASGVAMYQPVAADIDTAGQWTIYLALQLSNGPKTFTPDTLTVIAIH